MPHGVTVRELATPFSPPRTASAGLPVYIGAAPIHLSKSGTGAVNQPVLINSYEEGVELLGYTDDWQSYPLCEPLYIQFKLFNVAPAVFINVFDPSVGAKTVSGSALPVANRTVSLEANALPDTIVVKESASGATYVLNTDYTLAYSSGAWLVRIKTGGTIPASAVTLYISYKKADPTAVKAADITGSSSVDGKRAGISCVDSVFPVTRLVPGLLWVGPWGTNPEVAAVLTAKAGSINGMFRAVAVLDLPTDTLRRYADAPAWKEQNNYVSEDAYVAWPMTKIGDRAIHLSTQAIGTMLSTDADNGDVPFHSPSNQLMQATNLCLKDGSGVILGPEDANYLNDNGVYTGLNWIGGWRIWGNRTAAYPANTDVKDAFLSVRRMFNWVGNSIILSIWRRVDFPANRILIDDIVTSTNIWLSGLVAAGQLVGGRLEFLPTDNAKTQLMDGALTFRLYLCPPSPAQEIEFLLQYDPNYLDTLFS